jgi:glycerate 2-kinase
MSVTDPRQFLLDLFDAALSAALPESVVPQALLTPPQGPVVVLGAGKASASMALALEKAWPAVPLSGLVVTRYGHGAPCEHIDIVEAAHPVPDLAGQQAAHTILELAKDAGPDDTVVCLISGGASALLSLPAQGVTFEQKQHINTALLKSGAPIDEMNAVRKRLSAIKGGRLAAAIAPAASHTLLISDVPGDDPKVIGSGPTVPDDSGSDEALAVIARYAIDLPESLRAVMMANDGLAAMPAGHSIDVIAAPQHSLEAAAELARSLGVTPVILGDAIEGEAREVGKAFAGIARQIRSRGQPVPGPCVLLSGGETTVTVRGNGAGGRNSEFALGLAAALQGLEGTYAIACDTDGIDGSEDNAGALVTPSTVTRASRAGLDCTDALANNDAYSVFAALGDLVVSGPTLTNVNDFRAIYIGG